MCSQRMALQPSYLKLRDRGETFNIFTLFPNSKEDSLTPPPLFFSSTTRRGTFYHVINGTLYREKSCMFPSRCAGIEYFINQVISNISDISMVINTRDYPQSSKHFDQELPIFSFSKVNFIFALCNTQFSVRFSFLMRVKDLLFYFLLIAKINVSPNHPRIIFFLFEKKKILN